MISYQTIADKSYFCCLCLIIITAIASPISTAVTSVGCIAILVTWLISGKAVASLKISYQQPAGKIILLFFAWLLIGTLYAENDWGDKFRTILSWKKLLYTFILLGLFYQEEWKRRFINSYLLIMIVAAIASLILWLLGVDIREGSNWGAGVFMTNYSSQSMAFIAAIIICIFLLKEEYSQLKKIILSLSIVLFIFDIFFVSHARSSYFALPFAAIFATGCIYGYKKLPYIIAIISILVIALVMNSNAVQQRVKKGLTELANYQNSQEISSIGIRVIFAKNSIELIKEKPIIGYGTSMFKPIYSAYVAKRYQDWRGTASGDPHNIYFYIWLENGLIGLLLFLGYIYITIRQGLKCSVYGVMGASFLVAITASSLFNSHFKTFPEGHLLAFFSGVLLSQHKISTTEKKLL